MKNIKVFWFALLFSCVSSFAQNNDFDNKILEIKPKSINDLVENIKKVANTDAQKARALYVWIASNVRYDVQAFMKGVITDQNPEYVFSTKVAVCQGFSDLYYFAGKKLGLNVEVVTGFSKGYNYEQRLNFKQTDHAWNVVKIKNEWKLIDVTWGGGYINEKGSYVQTLNEEMYFAKPDKFIFKHLPADPIWQLNEVTINTQIFKLDSNKIKDYLLKPKNSNINYKDTLKNYETLDSLPKLLNSYYRMAKYNSESADGYYKLSWYYFTKSWKQMNLLNDISIQKDKKRAVPIAKESLEYINKAENYLFKVIAIDSDYENEINQKLKIIKQNKNSLEQIIKN